MVKPDEIERAVDDLVDAKPPVGDRVPEQAPQSGWRPVTRGQFSVKVQASVLRDVVKLDRLRKIVADAVDDAMSDFEETVQNALAKEGIERDDMEVGFWFSAVPHG